MKLKTTLIAGCVVSTGLYAQTWVGGTDSNWDTGANWSGGSAPNAVQSSVVFDAGSTTPSPLNINVASNVTVGDFTWTGSPTDITLSGAGVITMDDGTGSNNFLYTTNPVGSTLTIDNNMVFTSGQSSLISFNSRANITLNGNISGVAGVRKTGLGSLFLTGDNSYLGVTRIDANILQVDTSSAIGAGEIRFNVGGGSAANLVIENSSTFDNALNFTRAATKTGQMRIRGYGGTTNTFTTNSISAADADQELTLLRQTGSATVTTVKFTGTNLTTGVKVNIRDANNGLELAPASGTQTWSGIIRSESGGGGVTKSGGGTVVLSGDNTYTGETSVTAGTLLINGITSGQGAYTVDADATLGGGGTIGTDNADVTINGSLSAGNSPDTLTMDLGSGTLDVSGAQAGGLVFELGTTSDMIALTAGTLDVGTIGFSDFTFSDAGGLAAGDYTLFDTTATIVGSLDGSDLSGAIGSFTGTLSLADGGNDLILSVIPEPNAYALLTGCLAFGWIIIRRRK